MKLTRTTYTIRPTTHIERASCLSFIEECALGNVPVHPVIADTLVTVFAPAAAAYVAARAANQEAASDLEVASDNVATRVAAFDQLFGRWAATVDGRRGKGFAEAALRGELGNRTVAAFLGATAAEKVDKMKLLWVHLTRHPELDGDPEVRAELARADAALAASVSTAEAATRARSRRSVALVSAAKAFDKAWGMLVRDLRRYDAGGLGAQVPTFRRTVRVIPARGKVAGKAVGEAAANAAEAVSDDAGATQASVADSNADSNAGAETEGEAESTVADGEVEAEAEDGSQPPEG